MMTRNEKLLIPGKKIATSGIGRANHKPHGLGLDSDVGYSTGLGYCCSTAMLLLLYGYYCITAITAITAILVS
jgi:hypothetical protein